MNLKRLKEKRNEKGYTQIYMSEQLGITKQMYSFYEQGEKTPSLAIAKRIAKILEVELGWLCDKGE